METEKVYIEDQIKGLEDQLQRIQDYLYCFAGARVCSSCDQLGKPGPFGFAARQGQDFVCVQCVDRYFYKLDEQGRDAKERKQANSNFRKWYVRYGKGRHFVWAEKLKLWSAGRKRHVVGKQRGVK